MGCDIHAHVEIKAEIKGVKKWVYYEEINIPRNYLLFGEMARVRGESNILNIKKRKRLPEDVTDTTLFHFERWGEDAHSPNWLSRSELNKIGKNEDFTLFWGIFAEYREMTTEEGVLDFRLVFWFDN